MAEDKIQILFKLPVAVEQALRDEATGQRRSRQSQLIRILEERYGLLQTEEQSDELEPAAA